MKTLDQKPRKGTALSGLLQSKTNGCKKRVARGNMLFMSLAAFGLLLVAVFVGLMIDNIFRSQNFLQDRTDDFALRAAQQLNLNDYAGRMNNLIVHSRELVFTARQALADADSKGQYFLEPLAEELMHESCDGAKLVAKERERLVNVSAENLRQMLKEESLHPYKGVPLMTASTSQLAVRDFQAGWLKDTESNAEASQGIPELYSYDLDRNYVQIGKDLEVYRANLNLKLPPPDSDLEFILSPLPAPVKGTIAPLRSALGDSFESTLVLSKDRQPVKRRCQLSPSAVRVTMTMQVKQQLAKQLECTVMATGTACTNGASPELK